MYRCELCRKIVLPRVRCVKLVVKTRLKKYAARKKANRFRRFEKTEKGWKSKIKEVGDPGGVGREIVRELSVCQNCARSLKNS